MTKLKSFERKKQKACTINNKQNQIYRQQLTTTTGLKATNFKKTQTANSHRINQKCVVIIT